MTTEAGDHPPEPAGRPLTDGDEPLFRQVHPSFIRDGRPSSQAFRPTAKDHSMLSVARGALTTACDAYELHTAALGLQSAGTWVITVGECQAQTLEVVADPLTCPPEKVADPAHALIDFTLYSKNQQEAKAARLARQAVERGRLHPPSDDQPEEDDGR